MFGGKAGGWEKGRKTQPVIIIFLMLGIFCWPVTLHILHIFHGRRRIFHNKFLLICYEKKGVNKEQKSLMAQCQGKHEILVTSVSPK